MDPNWLRSRSKNFQGIVRLMKVIQVPLVGAWECRVSIEHPWSSLVGLHELNRHGIHIRHLQVISGRSVRTVASSTSAAKQPDVQVENSRSVAMATTVQASLRSYPLSSQGETG